MKRLLTITLALLCTCLATLRAADYNGSAPEAGKTYYLLNVQKGEFLSAATDGTLSMGGAKLSVTLSEENSDGYYTLTTNKGTLTASLWGKPSCDGKGKYDEWTLSLVSDADQTYAIGARSKEASSAQWLYYSQLLQEVRTEPFKPGDAFTNGQWKLVSEDQLEDQVVTLDETSESYTVPTIGASGSVEVHLKRTLTANSWNSLCVPFAIPADQLKAQFGDNVKVAELTSVSGTQFNFTSRTDIEAAKPYLVYVPETTTTPDYYTFTGVTSFASQPSDVTVSDGTESVTFKGNFYKTTAPASAYVLRKNEVYHLQSDMDIKGFRAVLAQDAPQASKVYNAWSLDGATTGIGSINASTATRFDVYNASGQMLRHGATSIDDLPHGVYIVNGKKITK